MPTDETVEKTEDVNASPQTEESPPENPETTDDITSHPKYKEMEEKHAAARKGMDKANLSKKELEAENARLRVLAGQESEDDEVPDEQPKSVTEKELAELEWKIKNEKRIALVEDDYEEILEEGYQGEKVSKNVALELAEKRAKIDSSSAQRDRHQDMATSSVTNRSAEEPIEITDYDRKFGITEKKKRNLERKYPHLKEPIS